MKPVKDKKIGLFGLSANPPHEGHVAMAKYARDMLGLDEIWWIVAKQNPLKSTDDMAAFSDRYDWACTVARDYDWLKVTNIEDRENTTRTFDTLGILKRQNPDHRFVLIIGGDNLTQLHKWYKWHELMDMVPIAVMARKGEMQAALHSSAAKYAKDFKIDRAPDLATSDRGWIILNNPIVPISSTHLRNAFKQHKPTVQGLHPEVARNIRQKGYYL